MCQLYSFLASPSSISGIAAVFTGDTIVSDSFVVVAWSLCLLLQHYPLLYQVFLFCIDHSWTSIELKLSDLFSVSLSTSTELSWGITCDGECPASYLIGSDSSILVNELISGVTSKRTDWEEFEDGLVQSSIASKNWLINQIFLKHHLNHLEQWFQLPFIFLLSHSLQSCNNETPTGSSGNTRGGSADIRYSFFFTQSSSAELPQITSNSNWTPFIYIFRKTRNTTNCGEFTAKYLCLWLKPRWCLSLLFTTTQKGHCRRKPASSSSSWTSCTMGLSFVVSGDNDSVLCTCPSVVPNLEIHIHNYA